MSFGGSSKSKSTSTTTNKELTKLYSDYSSMGEGNKNTYLVDVGDSQNVSLSMIDEGAVQKAFDFSGDVVKNVFDVETKSLENAARAQQAGYNMAGDVVRALQTATQGEFQTTLESAMKWGSVIVAAFLVIKLIKRR